MRLNVRSLIGKLNDPRAEPRWKRRAGTLPFAHALRRRDRALSDEAARFERWRLRLHCEALRHGQVAPGGGTHAQPGQAEVAATPAPPRVSPTVRNMLTEGWTIGSIDFGAGQGPHRLHHSRAGPRRRARPPHARRQQRVSEDRRPTALRKDFLKHRRRLPRRTADSAAADRGGGRSQGRAARRRRQDAQPRSVHRQPHRKRASRARSIRCWRATSKSARWSISSPAAARTTRS